MTGGDVLPLAMAAARMKQVSYVRVSDLEEASDDGGEAMVSEAYELVRASGLRLSRDESVRVLAVGRGRRRADAGRVVGALAMGGPPGGDVSFTVAVDPSHRGTGIGSELVSIAVREAAELAEAGAASALVADVVNDEVVRPMLLRRGFKPASGRWMRLALGGGGAYEPEEGAPEEGEWDRSGTEPRWRQAHAALVRDAVRSWKGDPVNLRAHMDDEATGAEWPSSGGGKIRRAQARALMWELANRPSPSPRKLYRGSHVYPVGVQSWSESPAVARRWAGRNGGRVFETPKGTRGLRATDYGTSAFDSEREWIVDSAEARVSASPSREGPLDR